MTFIILTNNVDDSPILLNVEDISSILYVDGAWSINLLSAPDDTITIKESATEVAAVLGRTLSNN